MKILIRVQIHSATSPLILTEHNRSRFIIRRQPNSRKFACAAFCLFRANCIFFFRHYLLLLCSTKVFKPETFIFASFPLSRIWHGSMTFGILLSAIFSSLHSFHCLLGSHWIGTVKRKQNELLWQMWSSSRSCDFNKWWQFSIPQSIDCVLTVLCHCQMS